jgi:hypothetical protein
VCVCIPNKREDCFSTTGSSFHVPVLLHTVPQCSWKLPVRITIYHKRCGTSYKRTTGSTRYKGNFKSIQVEMVKDFSTSTTGWMQAAFHKAFLYSNSIYTVYRVMGHSESVISRSLLFHFYI